MAVKTKAIKKYNAAAIMQSGRVGTIRYFQKNGFTDVHSVANSTVTNNRTNPQMTQRLKFAPLAAIYTRLGQNLYKSINLLFREIREIRG